MGQKSRHATLLVAIPGLLSCGSGTDSGIDAKPREVAPLVCTTRTGSNVQPVEIASGLTRPVDIAAPTGDERLFIVEQPGRIQIVDADGVYPAPFLDITDRVSDAGNERGLLGLAFHPDYANNGRFFVNYTENDDPGNTVIAEYTRASRDSAAREEARLLVFAQDFGNHNGGSLAFGPDGYLYVGSGDGGSGGDPNDRAENTNSLLGKILRLDVSTPGQLAIPADNPFVNGGGAGEVWHYGLRNPWRISFDGQNLYIGDVGQDDEEEISVTTPTDGGANLGWDVWEGEYCHERPQGQNDCGDITQTHEPLISHLQRAGYCSITGGVVYRGSCMPDVAGTYFYADICLDSLHSLQWDGQTISNVQTGATIGSSVVTFGRGGDDEVYFSRIDGTIYRLEIAP